MVQNSTLTTDQKEETIEDRTENIKTTTEKSEDIKIRNDTLIGKADKRKFAFIPENFLESLKIYIYHTYSNLIITKHQTIRSVLVKLQ